MNGRIRVWLDGNEISNGSNEWAWKAGNSGHQAVPPAALVESTSEVSIGTITGGRKGYDSSAYWFEGQIDDVLYYSRVLSEAEIIKNYKAGKRSHK